MGSKNELQNMTKRCRICLCERGAVVNFNDKAVRTMFQDLSKCTSIDLKVQDNLPNSICHICLYKMNDWTEFKERFAQSNKILMEKVNVAEASDNTIQNFDKEDRSAVDAKQKSLDQNNKESTSVTDKKKADASSSESEENTLEDIISISSDNEVPPQNFSSELKPNAGKRKNTGRKIQSVRKHIKSTEENTKEKSNVTSVKTTLSSAKRAKSALQNNWETKRKLFLANKDAGTLSSDSNSEEKKSPAKESDAEERVRKQKLEKALKKLEINLTQKYSKFPVHSDSDKGRRILHRRSCTPQPKKKWLKQSNKRTNNNKTESPMKKLFSENFSDSENTMDTTKEVESHENETFEPISWNSQLVVSDTIFNVSSILSLPGSPINSNNSSQNYDEKQESDIIDAMKLRRVNPTNDVKRCLELKVESAELDVLRRVQIGVANFIEKELKHKQLSKISSVTLDEPTSFNSVSRIDQKIKDLVEATFRKNVDTESWRISEHTKAVFQPRVMLERLDIDKESKLYNINNISTLKRNMSEKNFTESFNLYRKRQIVPPKRYNDYQTSLDSNSDNKYSSASEGKKKMITPKSHKGLKTAHSETDTHIATTNTTKNGITMSGKGNTVLTVRHTSEQSPDYEDAIRTQGAVTENHICGLCGNSFNNRKDVEIHVRGHRDVPSVVHFTADDIRGLGETATPRRKEKMMRCKRCKELVESRHVKEHSVKCNERSIYKCSLCGRKFVTPEQLSQHSTVDHGQQCKVVIDRNKNGDADTLHMITQSTVSATRCQETEIGMKTPDQINKNDIQSHKITSTAVRLEDISCFLCDKVFTDEEVLKNHLQDHCDQVPSDDEQEPEQYQCGICSKFMKTEELLQDHVNQHLYDESSRSKFPSNNQKGENDVEMESTELHSGGTSADSFNMKPTQKVDPQVGLITTGEWHERNMFSAAYQCLVCDELFDGDKLTEHISLHKASTNVCQLCDKPFRTEEELQEHVMTHM